MLSCCLRALLSVVSLRVHDCQYLAKIIIDQVFRQPAILKGCHRSGASIVIRRKGGCWALDRWRSML